MRRSVGLRVMVALVGLGLSVGGLEAQQATPPIATIQRLFDAMQSSDTAATRRLFVPFGRVVPLRNAGAALSVDQFVAYVASLAPASWKERIWEPRSETFGELGQVWFEYDVVRADTVRQCGRQSVQLSRVTDGWRIVSMAFLNSTEACTRAVK